MSLRCLAVYFAIVLFDMPIENRAIPRCLTCRATTYVTIIGKPENGEYNMNFNF